MYFSLKCFTGMNTWELYGGKSSVRWIIATNSVDYIGFIGGEY